MNPFKKSEIPDPVDTGKYALCKKCVHLKPRLHEQFLCDNLCGNFM